MNNTHRWLSRYSAYRARVSSRGVKHFRLQQQHQKIWTASYSTSSTPLTKTEVATSIKRLRRPSPRLRSFDALVLLGSLSALGIAFGSVVLCDKETKTERDTEVKEQHSEEVSRSEQLETSEQDPSSQPESQQLTTSTEGTADQARHKKYEARYTMVVLDKKSIKKLLSSFQPRFPDVIKSNHRNSVIVQKEPSIEEVEDLDDLLDTQVVFKVSGIAEDDHCQLVLLESQHIHVQPQDTQSYILLSSEDREIYDFVYAEALLRRIYQRLEIENNERDVKAITSWQGVLPESGDMPATDATYKLISTDTELQGTFCTDTKWKRGKCKHKRENQCAFCIFMKGGPCRREFIAWEKCVDIPNKEGKEDDDFIDRCAAQTLLLKTCVDNNPEYYYIVSEDDDRVENESDKKHEKIASNSE